ncbi:cytochrome P450 [Pisolithus orientalis]|uniref:cytochrome P450 n=1 Tax=Pisolithus orientalis TaxID=936130 RepID=UPI002223F52A|nr:cytochrome P450 [Pisolithus orientalis]KAI6012645.1 cytochrome P450 [Pisolithus orientalis]
MDPAGLLATVRVNPLAVIHSVRLLDVVAVTAAIWALRGALTAARRSFKTTKLRGPPRADLIYGSSKRIFESPDAGAIYEAWAKEYGVAFGVPTTLGGTKIMLTDPRALAHYYARETSTYVQTESARFFLQRHFGRGILWSQGEDHKRQRKSLTPAFSQAAIRHFTAIFYNSAHKAKAAWEAMIDASDGDSTVIEVQSWCAEFSTLDTIGLAGFSHDFGSLDGKRSSITELFDTFGSFSKRSAVDVGLLLLSQVIPLLSFIPTSRTKLLREVQRTMEDIPTELLARIRKEEEEGVLDGREDRSIIGVLVKANDSDSSIHLTREEVLAQTKVLLVAGYETTSITMTWALLELAGNPDIQNKLRQELLAFGEEPTYDQQQSGLPYLDAVVHETLRMHPPLTDFVRVAAEDDVIPLSEPVVTRSGETASSISVARGTRIGIPVSCINRSVEIWGKDAKVFRPERWLEEDGIPRKANDIQAYRHLLTFVDGPRTCLGKGFAVAEFKAVMSVLVKNFVFEMRDGPDTQVELGRGLLRRPRIVGEQGTAVPLRVHRYEG